MIVAGGAKWSEHGQRGGRVRTDGWKGISADCVQLRNNAKKDHFMDWEDEQRGGRKGADHGLGGCIIYIKCNFSLL